MSTIECTDETCNPTTGCDRVSPGCDNCYALTMAGRLKAMGQAKYQTVESWTGRELVVWAWAEVEPPTTDGGGSTSAAQGVAYDPASATWRRSGRRDSARWPVSRPRACR